MQVQKVPLKGTFNSLEINCKFQAENYIFPFEKDSNKKENFQVCVNEVCHVQWFRIKMNELRKNLSISTKQNKGISL